MEYLFLGILGIASFAYIVKKLYGGLNGSDSPCAGCSDKKCPFSGKEEYTFDIEIED